MTQFIREHYNVDGEPVVLVMTADRHPLQAWKINFDKGSLEREDDLAFVIEHQTCKVEFMPEVDFNSFCAKNNIDPTIPVKTILFTLALFNRTEDKLSGVIPSPKPTFRRSNVSPLNYSFC